MRGRRKGCFLVRCIFNRFAKRSTSTCVRLGAVGQFRELVEAAEKDRPLCETLKKVLKLTKVPPPCL